MRETALDNLLGGRIETDLETAERGLVKLVLALVETLRQVIERQAIRRVEGGTLTKEEIERLGLTLLRLEGLDGFSPWEASLGHF
ncbi:MAG: gvpK [Rhodospirillaceae bacterium]|nr:MAG: gvpK [Rhodospirillaceae bacterium]